MYGVPAPVQSPELCFSKLTPKLSLGFPPWTTTKSQAVFQTVKIMPKNIQVGDRTSSPTSSLPILKLNSLHPIRKLAAVELRRRSSASAVRASYAVEVANDSVALLERCFLAPAAVTGCFNSRLTSSSFSPSSTSELGSSRKHTEPSSPELDIGGGGGGDIGKKIGGGVGYGGSGGGDGDGGNNNGNDDYCDNFDDGDEEDETREQCFDRKNVDAVLSEWGVTLTDLPPELRQAYELGLVSSAQMTTFLSTNEMPTIRKSVSQALRPLGKSKAIMGRAMIGHSEVIGLALFFTAFRIMNVQLGEAFLRASLGVEVDPPAQSDEHLEVHSRPSEKKVQNISSKWLTSKYAVVSRLDDLLGIKQGNNHADSVGDAGSSGPKARRKRIVGKKVGAGSA